MTQRQRYAVLGTGALGGLYGGMLARAGHEVHFLLHSDYDHVRQQGLKIESRWGDFELPDVHAHASTSEMPPCDVTIVALKTTQNHLLESLLSAPTSGGGRVLVLQNGLGIESASANVVGPDRVLTGCCFLCSNKVGPGHIRHLDHGRIVFGCLDRDVDDIAQQTHDELAAAGIEVKLSGDMASVRWRKLLWNIPFNGLSVILDASSKELIEDPATLSLARELIDEVAAAAITLGHDIDESMKEQTIQSTITMVPYDSSMRLDYRFGRPLEIQAIFEAPLVAAKTAGVAMPRVEVLRDQLRFLDTRNRT
ncbi:MAG: putative 2-dehydropantoate 2-reductase [Planctomycetota bacterium]